MPSTLVADRPCKVGLLPFDNLQSTTFAYKFYKRTDTVGKQLAANFKKQFCRDVQVEFVGVWYVLCSGGLKLGLNRPTQGHRAEHWHTAEPQLAVYSR